MKKYKKWGIILTIIMTVGICGFIFRKQLVVLAFDMFYSRYVEQTLDKSYNPIEGREETTREVTAPFLVLLLGIDQRDKETGRSDTIICAVVNGHKVLLVSIPRDAYTGIICKGFKTKLGHAYAYCGVKGSIESVENLLGHKVDHYVTINFKGLKSIVDVLGGVRLPMKELIVGKDIGDIGHGKFYIKPNKLIYNGKEILDFSRNREDSDMNRTKRNRIVVRAIIQRIIEIGEVDRILKLFEIMIKNVVTDMRPKDIIDVGKMMYINKEKLSISNYMLHGDGKKIGKAWYYMVNNEDLDYVKNLLDNWLDPKVSKEKLIEPRQVEED